MSKIWGYVWVIVVAIGLAISLIIGIKKGNWFMENSSMILGWLLLLMQTSYIKIEKVYWVVQRVKYNLVNPDTVWDLSITYKTEGLTEDTIKKANQSLLNVAQLDRPELKQISDQRIEIRADELFIELFVDYGEQIFQIFFRKIPVSFRGSKRVIINRIIPILESIEKSIIISTKHYWLSVFFGNINPFFGLFIRRMKQSNITELNIHLKAAEDGELVISKDKITVYATSLSQLANDSKKYLSLSKLPA